MRTAAIVQARLGSSRLPGKVLMDLAGRTVLSHVIERCHAVPGVDVVCCAVPETPADDAVAAEAKRCGATVFRGSENDVLARYHGAARLVGADVVLRVTSDCPALDPAVCAAVLALRTDKDANYACNNMPPSWPHGLDCEAFTRPWLDRAAREATLPSEREHVTPFIRNHPQARRVNLMGPGGRTVDYRWTLDAPDDLAALRALFAHLPSGPEGWRWRAAASVMEAHPEIAALNTGHDRLEGLKKSLAQDAAQGASHHGR